MKKVILGIIAVATLSLTSCKKEDAKKDDTTATEQTATDGTATESSASTESSTPSSTNADVVKTEVEAALKALPTTPTFDNAEATELVNKIQQTAANLKAYSKVGDQANLATTQADFQKITTEMGKVMKKLKPEQQKQLTEWYEKVSQALTTK